MWNLLGFVVMVGVLLVARWALRIWDDHPHGVEEIDYDVVATIPGPRALPPVRL